MFLVIMASQKSKYAMNLITFSEWLARRNEGLLLPDRPPLKGMSRINPFPCTDQERKRLHVKLIKPAKLFPPTVKKVAEIVPQKMIVKLKPGITS